MPIDTSRIAANVESVRLEIAAACQRSGRDPATVTLMAVTKSQGSEVLPALRAAGVRDFGENRVDHLQTMRLSAERGDRWHYIGRVQGRQLPQITLSAHALHSLCDLDHVERLARACAAGGLRLPIYLQVNASGEAAKAGLAPADLPAVIARVRDLPVLSLVGLMTMAPELGVLGNDPGQIRACFASLASCAAASGLTGLSMGMSGDFAVAIEEGATVVRIGSRLFA